MQKDKIMRILFQRTITLPNPLWWMVASVIYPWRRVRRRVLRIYRHYFPPPPIVNYCEICGKDIGGSFWMWCSDKCLKESVFKSQRDPKAEPEEEHPHQPEIRPLPYTDQ